MKSLPRATLIALCVTITAIAVAGCGTGSARPQSSSPPQSPKAVGSSQPATATSANQRRAEADAAAIRASFVPPPGAHRLTVAPDAGEGVLKQPVYQLTSPNEVDVASWWLAPGQPTSVLAWEQTHLPRRFTKSAWGSTGPTDSLASFYEFDLPDVPAVLNLRELIVTVVSAGNGQSAIRADAEVTWVPAKPATERVPAATESVTIATLPPAFYQPVGKPPAAVTITNRQDVRRIASLVDGLTVSVPVFPVDDPDCPMTNYYGMLLTFHGAGAQVLAVLTFNQTGCDTVTFTLGGKPLLTMDGAEAWEQQVLAAAGLHWPHPKMVTSAG